MALITVYRFKKFEVVLGEYKTSQGYARLETIESIQGLVPIKEDSIQVEESTLDGNGIYIPNRL